MPHEDVDIIYESRIKAEKQVAYIRIGLMVLFIIFVIIISFNPQAEGIPAENYHRAGIVQYIAIISSVIATALSLYFLFKNKYSLLLSCLMITHDILILAVVDFVMCVETPSLSITTGIMSVFILFVILSGLRYSLAISLYSGVLASLCYLLVIILNAGDIIRFFGQPLPVFTGHLLSGKTATVYFDLDDIVLNVIMFNIIGFSTGFIAENNKKLILKQAKLAEKNESLRKVFISNIQQTINANDKSTSSLQESIEVFKIRLESFFSLLTNISKSSAVQAEYITDSVNQLSKIDTSFGRIDNEVTDQSSRISVVSEKISQLVTNIHQINQSTISTRAESKTLAENAMGGSETVQKMVAAVRQIEEDSKEIVNMVNLITEIAEKTNILSVNAAIEAANSGIAGKGFGIIALEVRNLAKNSTQKALEIRKIIDNIKEKIKTGVFLSEETGRLILNILQSIKSVENQVQFISEAAGLQSESAGIIRDNVGEIVKKTISIQDNIHQERDFSNQIVKKVSDIKKITDETLEEVSKESALSQDISQSVVSITEIVSENTKLALTLSESLSQFQNDKT